MIDASWYTRPENIPDRTSAGGVVVRLEADRLLVALVGGEGARRGYILPKGGVESGESLEEAARREIEEEAGLSQLVLLRALDVLERLNWARTCWTTVHYFLFSTEQMEGRPTDEEYDYRLEWFPLDALPDLFWPEQRRLIEENREAIRSMITRL